jgi:AraC-like DNA-binding protein
MRREPFALRVRDLIVQRGITHQIDMEAIARSLGISVRSLRRRFAAEGTSYKTVVNEARATVAKELLRNNELTIQQAAFEMGFTATSTFHRAFKRWTGMTPLHFRAHT